MLLYPIFQTYGHDGGATDAAGGGGVPGDDCGQRDVLSGGQRQEVPGRGDQTEHPRHRGVRGVGDGGPAGSHSKYHHFTNY